MYAFSYKKQGFREIVEFSGKEAAELTDSLLSRTEILKKDRYIEELQKERYDHNGQALSAKALESR